MCDEVPLALPNAPLGRVISGRTLPLTGNALPGRW